MKTIAFFSQKGGAGKTTLALHTAVAALQEGLRVAVLDLDPQASALAWSRLRRGSSDPVVVAVPDSQLAHALEGAANDRFDLAIIDSPPHAAPVAARIVAAADLVVVPVRPSPMDLAALPATLRLIGSKRAGFVLSACPQRAPETEETRALLSEHGYPVWGPVTDRRAFFRALTAGQSVSEFEPEGAAADEIRALFSAIRQELKL
jgi:chromosome partitioning protein